MRDLPRVAVIILNWNSTTDTFECLASIQKSDYPAFSAFVVDNGSNYDSLSTIRGQFPSITIIETGSNLGFAAGNNRGLEYAAEMDYEWVLLLNPDVTIASDCLSQMMKVASRDPKIAVLGPMIYHASEPTTIQSAGGTLDKLWVPVHRGQNGLDCGQYDGPVDVDWVSGCAMLINTQAIKSVGGFDERFFMYEEELDLCIRARRLHWRVTHVPRARVWHKGVARDYSPSPRVTYYMTRNHLLLLSKHRAGAWPSLLNYFQVLRTLVSWTVRPKWSGMRQHRESMSRAVVDYLQGSFGCGSAE